MSAADQTTTSSSESDLRKRLDSLDALLREKRKDVLELLAEHSSSDVRDLRYALFAYVCDGIYEGAKAFEVEQGNVDFPFYVWPGYNSTRSSDPSKRRVQLSAQLDGSVADEILCGISPAYDVATLLNQGKLQHPGDSALRDYSESEFRTALEDICKKRKSWEYLSSEVRPTLGLTSLEGDSSDVFRLLANPCSVFFNLLLHRLAPPGCDFIPGSTHRWLLENMDLKIQSEDVERPLKGLAIHYEDEGDRGPGFKTYFPIRLLAKDLIVSGPYIGAKLDEISQNQCRWPIPVFDPPDGENDNNLLMRRFLYSPWLSSVFAPHRIVEMDLQQWGAFWTEGDTNITPPDYLKEYFTLGKTRLERMSAPLRALLLHWAQYNHWLSLALDEAPETRQSQTVDGDKSSLGSLMLFSGRRLSTTFLTVVRSWVQEIYLLLRSHESVLVAAEVSEKEQRYQFAHDAKGKIQKVIFDPNFSALDRHAQYAAHLLHRDIFLWNASGSPLRPSDPPEQIVLRNCSEMARVLAWQHLESKLGSTKPLQKDTLPDEEERLRSNFRRIFYSSQEHSDEKLFSDETVFSSMLAGVITTRWRVVLEALLVCALRQSLCHSAICRERLALQNRVMTHRLHGESVVPSMATGVQFIIEGRCLKDFRPDQTTEGKTVNMLVGLTSGAGALVVKWEVTPDADFFISRLLIHDPSATLL